MARAHFVTYLLDSEGRPIPGATVTVREPDTESQIAETIFAADDPDGTTKTNPFTADADGKCEIWLTAPKIVDLYIEKTGYEPSTIRSIAHQLTASTLTVAEAGTPLAQRATLNFLAGFDLTDDAVSDETEVAIDLSEVTAFTDHSAQHEDGGSDEISIQGLAGTPVELTTHLNDAADAHDASAISVLDAGALLAATDVEAALAEIQGNVDTDEAALAAHLADAADAHDASAISVLDSGALFAATDVEAALAETAAALNTDEAALAAHIADAADAHDASAISIVDAGGEYASSDVEGALGEIADSINTLQGVGSVKYARKTSSESVISSTTLQNDNELLISVGASEVWDVEFVILYISTSDAGDLKWDITIPGTGGFADGFQHGMAVGASATGDDQLRDVTEAGSSAGCLNAAQQALHIKMLVTVGNAGGNLQFRWAQNTSNATGTNVEAGSYMVATRVA